MYWGFVVSAVFQDFSTSTFDLEGQMLIFKPSADTKHQNKYEMCKQPLLNSLHPDVPSSAAEKLKIFEDKGGSKIVCCFELNITFSLIPGAVCFFGTGLGFWWSG